MEIRTGKMAPIPINQGKSFAISIVGHLLIIAAIFSAASHVRSGPQTLVMDFVVLASPRAAKTVEKVNTVPPVPRQAKAEPVKKPAPPSKPVPEKVLKKTPPLAALKPEPIPPVEPLAETKPVPEPVPAKRPKPEPIKEAQTSPPEPQVVENTVAADSQATQISEAAESAVPLQEDLPTQAIGPSLEESVADHVAAYTKSHFSHIQSGIQQNIHYPRTARRMGWEGRVVVEFIICEDGNVKNIQIAESSGYDALDRNAVNTIERAAPFPIPPIPAKLIIPVIYRLS